MIGDLALHVAHDMHDVGVPLDLHELRHLDSAGLGNTTDVVAPQVDQHDVLGDLFLVCQEIGGIRLIFRLCRAARPRTGNRMVGDSRAFQPHQQLR